MGKNIRSRLYRNVAWAQAWKYGRNVWKQKAVRNKMTEGCKRQMTDGESRIDRALEELIYALQTSPEYGRYQEIRRKIREYPQLEEAVHAFRKKNYEAQNFMEGGNLYNRMEELERESEQLRKDPLIDEYLKAELALCRLFQNINWTIVRNIDFDLGFIVEK